MYNYFKYNLYQILEFNFGIDSNIYSNFVTVKISYRNVSSLELLYNILLYISSNKLDVKD